VMRLLSPITLSPITAVYPIVVLLSVQHHIACITNHPYKDKKKEQSTGIKDRSDHKKQSHPANTHALTRYLHFAYHLCLCIVSSRGYILLHHSRTYLGENHFTCTLLWSWRAMSFQSGCHPGSSRWMSLSPSTFYHSSHGHMVSLP
jgi:hypothetical protein